MVRLGSAALIVLSLPGAALSSPPPNAEESEQMRSFALPQSTGHHRFAPDGIIGRAEIAPNAHFGFGIFGLKAEKTYLQPVTGREIGASKQRRAAVGFLLKF
jgi:hypothetical protein